MPLPFSAKTREELTRIIPKKKCCCLAEIAGLTHTSIKSTLEVDYSSAAIARKLLLLLKRVGFDRPSLVVRRQKRQYRYRISLTEPPVVVQPDEHGLPTRRCCRRAFLRGVFLTSGSITTPDRTYHLEINLSDRKRAQRLVQLLEELGVRAQVTPKRQGYVIYIKDGEQIGEFLRLVEAHQAVLALENIRIVKGMKNRINRLVNAETANVDKTIKASMQQTAAIEFLAKRVGIRYLPYRLRAVARARIEMPYASLTELGAGLTPPISKSAVNYRLRKLQAMATELGFDADAESE
ncbi:MAG: DNA-binding protein WhiA [Limnochordia bacterium]